MQTRKRLLDGVARCYGSTFGQATLGAAVFWVALPPLDLWPLAWIAPIWWLMLIRRRELAGQRPYGSLWLAGFLFWLAAIHWLRLPFWATAFGWVALSAYLGCYLPLFVGLSRVAVHRCRIPLLAAAPAVYMGLELARGHVLTGFNMAALAHTQYRWIDLIQVSDLGGEYLVSFVIVFVAACVAELLPCDDRRWRIWPLGPLVLMLAGVLGYGRLRVAEDPPEAQLRIALIQGSIDTQINLPPSEQERIFPQYYRLSEEAVRQHGKLDLVVWPESMFPAVWITGEDQPAHPWREFQEEFHAALVRMGERFGAMVLGVDRRHFTAEGVKHYNTAVHVSSTGAILGAYDKRHLVMFGEYVPLTGWFPWLRELKPVNSLNLTLDPGEHPAAFEVGPLRVAPNICYESVLPHVIRRQLNVLAQAGQSPHVLLNLTNDGWFWGSSELDMHLVCGVFRAVECRKPFLIAANTGISAWIDADGRVRRRGPKRDTAVVLAEPSADRRTSWYLWSGDWPAGLCLAACAVLAGLGAWERWFKACGTTQCRTRRA